MLAAVIARPLRAGCSGDRKMFDVVQLDIGEGFGNGVPLEGYAGGVPGGAPIDGMEEGSTRATRPHLIADGSNGAELYALSDWDQLEGFSPIRGALDISIG